MSSPSDRVFITVELAKAEARHFAKFLRDSTFSDYRKYVESEAEVHSLIRAVDRVQAALADAGCASR